MAARGADVDTAVLAVTTGDVTEHLEREGLAKFEKNWSELGATIAAELDRQYHGRVETN